MKLLSPSLRNMPLQRKLLALVIPLLIVTVGITGFYSYTIASGEVVDKIRQAQMSMALKTKDQLDFVANNTLSFANYLFLNPTVQGMVMNGDTPQRRDLVYKSLLPLMVTGETIQSLILYPVPGDDSNGQPFTITQTGIASAISLPSFQLTSYYERLNASKSKVIWDMLIPSDNILTGDNHYKLVLIKNFKSFYDYKQNGVLILGLDADKLSRSLFHDKGYGQNDGDGAQFIVNERGIVLAATDISWIGKPITSLPLVKQELSVDIEAGLALDALKRNDSFIVSDSYSEVTGWHTVVIQDRSTLVAELNHIGSATVTIMAIVSIIAILLSWVIARVVTNPMKKLMHSMKALQIGDFSQRVSFTGNDEIGRLGYLYNSMVSQIKMLIDDVYASSLKQREAELKALQSQINPHFLYNTLNLINWSAVQKGDNEISEMVVSLSQVFRLSLNSGNEYALLEQEMELVRHYLFLQKKRYTSRFSFEIEMDPIVSKLQMPKLLLQPLVENAIIHGIEPSEGNGIIYVRAYAEQEWAVLEVTDNGPGMPEEQVKRLLGKGGIPLRNSNTVVSHSGMALSNIKERLALFYEQSVFDIESREGIGTRVQVRIKQGVDGHVA
ncbi:sensor histidine kinase [Paenibacillus sp. 2TAB19]